MIPPVHLALRGVLPLEELSVELKLLIICVRDAVRAGEGEELPPADLAELVAVGRSAVPGVSLGAQPYPAQGL